jgi:hypothetical protein
MLFVLISISVYGEDQIINFNGKKIILHDNYSWEYAPDKDVSNNPIVLTSIDNFDQTVTGKSNKYSIKYNSSKWTVRNTPSGPGEFSFQNNDNTGFGTCIYDGLQFSLPVMEKVLIANAIKVDPNAAIINKEDCIINGNKGELVAYAFISSGVKFELYSFIVCKENGSIQFTFYTTDSTFEKLKQSFIEAMTGLVF